MVRYGSAEEKQLPNPLSMKTSVTIDRAAIPEGAEIIKRI